MLGWVVFQMKAAPRQLLSTSTGQMELLGTASSTSWEMLPIESLEKADVCCFLLKVGMLTRCLFAKSTGFLLIL